MKITLKIEKEFDAKFLQVEAGVRYWEDATVNGVEDSEGDLIPCRVGDYWRPLIELETGKIKNWKLAKPQKFITKFATMENTFFWTKTTK